MQLILDADNINIGRNMSTIEQESLNEKFLTVKVIDNLTDDVITGNKENIQKQENIILDKVEDGLETDKEITASATEVLVTNSNIEKRNENVIDTQDVQAVDEIMEVLVTNSNAEKKNENLIDTEDVETVDVIMEELVSNSNTEKRNENLIDTQDVQAVDEIIEELVTNTNIEKINEKSIDIKDVQAVNENMENRNIKNIDNEESLQKQNEKILKKSNNTDISETKSKVETETDHVNLDKISNVSDKAIVSEINIREISNELNEGNEEKEVDISELSMELNEEKQMDLDKEVDVIESSSELDKVIDIEENDDIDTVVEKESSNEVSNTVLDDKTQEVENRETESVCVNKTEQEIISQEKETKTSIENESDAVELEKDTVIENEKCTAIEIDDEDEKTSESTVTSSENSQNAKENLDKADGIEIIEEANNSKEQDNTVKKPLAVSVPPKRICKLSNNLDIFSDEEDDQPEAESPKDNIETLTEKQCINIDDDDDIMLIDEDSSTKDIKKKDEVEDTNSVNNNVQPLSENTDSHKTEMNVENKPDIETIEETSPSEAENIPTPTIETPDVPIIDKQTNKTAVDKPEEAENIKKPLLPKNFLNTCKKNLADMTRNDLEEFCILKIVESIVDRSNLGEIKTHLKNLTQTMEECKNKCLMLTKQNKDLHIVLKSVQEEQKLGSNLHITPLKITRSVGMQVVMVADKSNNVRKKSTNGAGTQAVPNNNAKQVKPQQNQNTRNQKEKAPLAQQIPVPRLVPALPAAVKTNQTTPNAAATKQVNSPVLPNGIRNSPPTQKVAEKRPRSQAVTVDLTDDEPPAKLQNVQRGPVNQPMRVLTTPPNLIPAQRFNQNMNSPRKVYIPISGPQAQNVRPGQTIMLKTLSALGPRPRGPGLSSVIAKLGQNPNQGRNVRGQPSRHPAPLPDAMKQYQSPNWKSLPPAPDLKLSKVENGIVISWKIDGYQEENHEEIASYQLYAYQETTAPPNTALWKKIGDVKALPLPMACTLTQFMAGFKYYFAVRAVDIRSRFGPFSLPGSILLLNKL